MAERVYLCAVCGQSGNYGAVFPDFPGCTSAADSLAALMNSATEALGGHIEVMQEFGDTIPEPRPWTLQEAIRAIDPEGEENWLELLAIAVDLPGPKAAVAVLVSSGLAAEIDTVSASRTDFVERAVTHELERIRKSA